MRAVAVRPDRRGFTLIELIVTIVILGVLAALAVPAFQAVIERSRKNGLEQSGLATGREMAAFAAFDSVGFDAGDSGADSDTDDRVRGYLDELYGPPTYDPSGGGSFLAASNNAPVFGPAAGTSLVGGTSTEFGNHRVVVLEDGNGDQAPTIGERCMIVELSGDAGDAPAVSAGATRSWQGDWDGCI